MIKEDFPSETISTENPELLQSFNRKVKNGRVEIDSDNKKTYPCIRGCEKAALHQVIRTAK